MLSRWITPRGSLAQGWMKQRKRGEARSQTPGGTTRLSLQWTLNAKQDSLPRLSPKLLILHCPKMPCLLLPRASKGPPNLATQLKPSSLCAPPCPSLSCPAEQRPQPLPGQDLRCPSAPPLRLWSGSCPLLSVAPMCAFLACSSHQNLNFGLGFS